MGGVILCGLMPPVGAMVPLPAELLLFTQQELYAATPELETQSVSIVISRAIAPYVASAQGTQQALKDAGIRTVQVQNMAGDLNEAGRIAAELRAHPPDVIVTVGTEATRAMRREFDDIPIISSMVVHPETLLEKDQSVYGASLEVPAGTQLSSLKELLPSAQRVGILYNPTLHGETAMDRRREAARENHVELVLQPVSAAADIPKGLQALLVKQADALWLIPDETVLAPETVQNLLLETLRSRLPVVAPSLLFVQRGALLGVGGDYREVGRQAGEMAVSLLSGKRLAAPMTEARKAVLYLNLRSAQALGIDVPKALIDRAEQVIR